MSKRERNYQKEYLKYMFISMIINAFDPECMVSFEKIITVF